MPTSRYIYRQIINKVKHKPASNCFHSMINFSMFLIFRNLSFSSLGQNLRMNPWNLTWPSCGIWLLSHMPMHAFKIRQRCCSESKENGTRRSNTLVRSGAHTWDFGTKGLEVEANLNCNYAIYICIAKDLNCVRAVLFLFIFWERFSSRIVAQAGLKLSLLLTVLVRQQHSCGPSTCFTVLSVFIRTLGAA